MRRTILYILVFLGSYFALRYWRHKKLRKKETQRDSLERKNKSKASFDWDAEEIDYEEIESK